MKSYCISDNHDTLVGMKLVGIEGAIAHERQEVLKLFEQATQDQMIGLVIMTEKIVDLIKEEVLQFKVRRSTPLIIEIPDRHGTSRKEDSITAYIRESVGIKV